jgi:hypothetical protein
VATFTTIFTTMKGNRTKKKQRGKNKKTPLQGVQRGFVLQDKLNLESFQQFHDPCSRFPVYASVTGALLSKFRPTSSGQKRQIV